ncbi:hypothetical protein HY496_00230 [Candidatus Woesearchaeota archaeon]|nr:hypothetical protein [Candidatus Woesearchaeota archaeon]
MMTVKIVKVKHSGKSEAKKLRSYIHEADVFSHENAAMTAEKAARNESEWEGILSSGISRRRFQEFLRLVVQQEPKETGEYLFTMYDLMFQSRVATWYLERFSSSQAEEIMKNELQADTIYTDAVEYFRQGDNDNYLRFFKQSLELNAYTIELRDREIAGNLEIAEEAIREQIPRLRTKDTIHLAAMVGGFHHPERYSKKQVDVVTVMEPPQDIGDRINQAILKGESFESMKPLLLEYGRSKLSTEPRASRKRR